MNEIGTNYWYMDCGHCYLLHVRMVIDCCHGYVNAWMYGSYSTFSCSNLIQAKESEQFQYFAIKNNETRFYSQLIQFLQSAKENGGWLLCMCEVQVVIFYIYSGKLK